MGCGQMALMKRFRNRLGVGAAVQLRVVAHLARQSELFWWNSLCLRRRQPRPPRRLAGIYKKRRFTDAGVSDAVTSGGKC